MASQHAHDMSTSLSDSSSEEIKTQEKDVQPADLKAYPDADPKTQDFAPTSADPETADDPRTVRPIHGWRWIATVASLYSFALLYGLDTTITADVQPAIVHSLGNVQKLAWVGAGFPLGSVSTILPIAFAYGLFELKTFVVIGIIVFEAGSAVCGAAPTMDVLIIGRVIAGMGGASMYIGALTFMSVFTTIRERSIYNALIGMTWGLGTILGPIVGGLFAEKATWRWAFYINLVLAGIFLPITLYLTPRNQPRPDKTFLQKLRIMDWLGIVLIAAVYVTYVVAITFGGALWPWSGGRFIATITVCGVLLITFIVTQYFSVFTSNPVYPSRLLKSRTLILLYIGTATSAATMTVGAYFIPLYFQFVHQDSALKAAVRLLPFIVLLIFCVMLNGALLPRVGYYYPWYIFSGICIMVGGILMHTVDINTSTSKIYGYTSLMGIGAGLVAQSGYVISQAKVTPEEASSVISFMNLGQIGSIVIALTIAGTVFQNTAIRNLTNSLAGHGFSVPEIKSAVAGTQSVIFQKGSPEVKELALKAIIGAMDDVFILLIVAGAVGITVGLLMKREKVLLPTIEL